MCDKNKEQTNAPVAHRFVGLVVKQSRQLRSTRRVVDINAVVFIIKFAGKVNVLVRAHLVHQRLARRGRGLDWRRATKNQSKFAPMP